MQQSQSSMVVGFAKDITAACNVAEISVYLNEVSKTDISINIFSNSNVLITALNKWHLRSVIRNNKSLCKKH